MISSQYAAGFFDGEGTVYVGWIKGNHRCIQMRVSITNTNKDILVLFQDTFGGKINSQGKPKLGHKQAFRWDVRGILAQKFLKEIQDYTVVKKEAISHGLTYVDLQHGYCRSNPIPDSEYNKRLLFLEEMRRLNKRGTM